MSDLERFRAETREWLEANCPASMRTPMTEDEAVWGGRNATFANPDSKLWLDRMAERGWTAPTWPKAYGGGGLDHDENRILQQELTRIHARPALESFGIWMLGPALLEFASEEQKQRFLPPIVRGEIRWCQGYSEPGAGSDLAGLQTRADDQGDHYLVNGSKYWITNGCIAGVAIVAAKLDDVVRLFVIDTDTPGFSTNTIKNKFSLRASVTSELVLEDVKVPKDTLLPGVEGLKGPLSCLNSARFGIAFGAVGSAMAVYDEALRYSKNRIMFDRPIARFQLVQNKLVWMINEITKAQLLAWRLGRLKEMGRLHHSHVSLAKRNNCWMALECCRLARDVLGANGITDEYQVMRHMCNLESVITYEGTHDIHALIVGREISGENAIA